MTATSSSSGFVRSVLLLSKLALAIVAADLARRGGFDWAAWYIVLAVVLDRFESPAFARDEREVGLGLNLRLTVNALCFGVAPALVTYETFLWNRPWGLGAAVVYALGASVAVARAPKVRPGAGHPGVSRGLPPQVGAVLVATIYPFFNVPEAAVLTGGLPVAEQVGGILACALAAMVSPVPYRIPPRLRFEAKRVPVVIAAILAAALTLIAPEYVLFPAAALYMFWGLAVSLVPVLTAGLLEPREDADTGRTGLRVVAAGALTPLLAFGFVSLLPLLAPDPRREFVDAMRMELTRVREAQETYFTQAEFVYPDDVYELIDAGLFEPTDLITLTIEYADGESWGAVAEHYASPVACRFSSAEGTIECREPSLSEYNVSTPSPPEAP